MNSAHVFVITFHWQNADAIRLAWISTCLLPEPLLCLTAGCAGEWKKFNGSYIIVCRKDPPVLWTLAREICTSMQADLIDLSAPGRIEQIALLIPGNERKFILVVWSICNILAIYWGGQSSDGAINWFPRVNIWNELDSSRCPFYNKLAELPGVQYPFKLWLGNANGNGDCSN